VCLLLILSHKLDLNQETRFTINALFKASKFVADIIVGVFAVNFDRGNRALTSTYRYFTSSKNSRLVCPDLILWGQFYKKFFTIDNDV
jgi:hypothetical protein